MVSTMDDSAIAEGYQDALLVDPRLRVQSDAKPRDRTKLTVAPPSHTDTMGYENYVYLAKLAEQAERYEGMPSVPNVR